MLGTVSKAIAAALAAATGATATTYLTIPNASELPWWVQLAIPLANAAIGYVIVYVSPANRYK